MTRADFSARNTLAYHSKCKLEQRVLWDCSKELWQEQKIGWKEWRRYDFNSIFGEKKTFGASTFHQLAISSTRHFINLPLTISLTGHFTNLAFHHLTISLTGHFINLSFYQLDISSTWNFTNLPFDLLTISSTYHFINLPFQQLAIPSMSQKKI
jgi:hypothetical protein